MKPRVLDRYCSDETDVLVVQKELTVDMGTRGIEGSMGCRRETLVLGIFTMVIPDQERGLHFCPALFELVDLRYNDSRGQGYRWYYWVKLCCPN
jgi:hypothetical protein